MYQALQNAMAPQIAQGQQAITSQFAASGLGSGSPLMESLGQYQTNVGNNFLSTLANYTYNASEAAANRQLSASQFGETLMSGLGSTTYQQYIATQGNNVLNMAGAGASGLGSTLSVFSALSQLGLL